MKTVTPKEKLQHNISAVHQTLNLEARTLERLLRHHNIHILEISNTIEVLKNASQRSQAVLQEYYKETGFPRNKQPEKH